MRGKTALVIPSIREESLSEFFRHWQRGCCDWDVAIIIEGNERRTFSLRGWGTSPFEIVHISHAEIRARLGDDAWIISRGDSACRCYGFLLAAELGCEWILNLDDDVRPAEGVRPICAAHLAAMRFDRCRSTCPDLHVRGLPYRSRGELSSLLNCGLWRGVPDLDAAHGLAAPRADYEPPPGSTLAHPLARYPLCGMNLFFHRSLVPALYFPPMGEGQPFARYDDIWAGWLFQRVAEHCRVPWSFGAPHVEHRRASNPLANAVKEAPGLPVNEALWQRLDSIELTAPDLAGAVAEIAADLAADPDSYLAQWGRALAVWLRLLA